MPGLPVAGPLSSLVNRQDHAALFLSLASSNATNAAPAPVQVVCAWPVSGQYGPGSRVLYYFLVAACILARKAEWLRNACLAAALLWPAVAALHAIALAALHDNDAVDMDIYGTFQLCSVAVLTAPVVVRLSRTYFFDPGRNIIFLWTIFLLAGLLSLTVEFYRTNPVTCSEDAFGNPILGLENFPYGQNGTCGITCDTDRGPFSSMRGGAQNNVYVIPIPSVLGFGTATLLSAACCIPSILSLIFMWEKILEINWKRHFGSSPASQLEDDLIEGTNGATPATMKGINKVMKRFLGAVEAPMFGIAVLTILIWGEINLGSKPVIYETEPMGSVGQWAPIVGTGLAAAGSLYLWLAKIVDEETNPYPATHHCTCSHHHDIDDDRHSRFERPSRQHDSPRSHAPSIRTHTDEGPSSSPVRSPSMQEVGLGLYGHDSHHHFTASDHGRGVQPGASVQSSGDSNDLVPTFSRASQAHTTTSDAGRRRVARALTAFSNYIGTAAQDRYDTSEFQSGKATNFPEIPGEAQRNPALAQIREQYNVHHEKGAHTPRLYRSRSRAGSFVSNASGLADDAPRSPRTASPHPAFPSVQSPPRLGPRGGTFPTTGRSTSEPLASTSGGPRPTRRRDTLEVPGAVHLHQPLRDSPPLNHLSIPLPISPVSENPSSPAFVSPSSPTSPARIARSDSPPPILPPTSEPKDLSSSSSSSS